MSELNEELAKHGAVPYVLSPEERKNVFAAVRLPEPTSSTVQPDGSVISKVQLPKAPALLHHTCESNYVDWAKYSPEGETLYLAFPGGSVYAYEAVPAKIWDDLKTAKDSTAVATDTTRGPIGAEKPGSEGSYLIFHVVGKDRKATPPFKYWKLTSQEIEDLGA